jgi:hypothetical protein
MANPIEATPTLKGEDARRLLEDLQEVCSCEEKARRIARARAARAETMRPKSPSHETSAEDMEYTRFSLSQHKF